MVQQEVQVVKWTWVLILESIQQPLLNHPKLQGSLLQLLL